MIRNIIRSGCRCCLHKLPWRTECCPVHQLRWWAAQIFLQRGPNTKNYNGKSFTAPRCLMGGAIEMSSPLLEFHMMWRVFERFQRDVPGRQKSSTEIIFHDLWWWWIGAKPCYSSGHKNLSPSRSGNVRYEYIFRPARKAVCTDKKIFIGVRLWKEFIQTDVDMIETPTW